jgi:DNA-binding GntR family transcriptional regulator
MPALSLAPRALYEEVAELLRQRIFARELEAGSWIDELRIAEALGISRTPLREALKVLAAEGLVTMKVRRGAYVTEVSEKDLRDVYHLLALLESDAARVVAAAVGAHGAAGSLAAADGRPVTAMDVVDALPDAIALLRRVME